VAPLLVYVPQRKPSPCPHRAQDPACSRAGCRISPCAARPSCTRGCRRCCTTAPTWDQAARKNRAAAARCCRSPFNTPGSTTARRLSGSICRMRFIRSKAHHHAAITGTVAPVVLLPRPRAITGTLCSRQARTSFRPADVPWETPPHRAARAARVVVGVGKPLRFVRGATLGRKRHAVCRAGSQAVFMDESIPPRRSSCVRKRRRRRAASSSLRGQPVRRN
jgi:hypothetical protein